MNLKKYDFFRLMRTFAKKGLTPSQIGVILRDSHGIAQVKSVVGNKILRILKPHGIFHFEKVVLKSTNFYEFNG
jgi:hypothetical protein